jgi:sortase A
LVVLGSIAIPSIGIDRSLYEGIRLPTFDLGPGHWPGTAMPGQIGNMVIGGHRTDGNADFADLDQLQPGAEVIVTDVSGTAFVYLVEQVEITDPFAARTVYQTPERTATLFACHPPGSVAQRIVVHLTLRA